MNLPRYFNQKKVHRVIQGNDEKFQQKKPAQKRCSVVMRKSVH